MAGAAEDVGARHAGQAATNDDDIVFVGDVFQKITRHG